MKKIICKVEYNTEISKEIAKYTEGNFGDESGFEEALYETENGKFFLYVNGGSKSPYKKEDIKRLSPQKAEEWKKQRNI